MHFATVEPGLFQRVVNRCARPGTPCMNDVMAQDRSAGGGHPQSNQPGTGMPSGRNAPPPSGAKPEGAIFKEGNEIAPVPNVTKPRQPGAPGATQPGSPRNRDMSFLLPTVPGAARTARG
jgi:cytochrome o ubiquinol oxidase subunit 2